VEYAAGCQRAAEKSSDLNVAKGSSTLLFRAAFLPPMAILAMVK